MRYRKNILMLLLLPLFSLGQNSNVSVEQQVKEVYRKVYPACVRAYGIDSTTSAQNSAQFSAVVVSADGVILTVAHAVKPGLLYRISFPCGKTGLARALGRIATDRQTLRPDVAMMRMIETGPWPYVETGTSASLIKDQTCFGISYPESQNLMVPMLRWGRILNTLNEWGFVESSCIMETGDSGGPLFDVQGKLIGLHSRIDKPEGANYEVPIDIYTKYFTALQVVKNYDSLPDKADQLLPGKTSLQPNGATSIKEPTVPALVKTKSEAVVKMYSSRDTILGTVFQLKNGKQMIISKSSEVGDSARIQIAGRIISLKIIGRDPRKDLVALSFDYRFPQPLIAQNLKVLVADDRDFTGRFLHTALPGKTSKGSIGGLLVDELPNRLSSGGFNAWLQEQDGCPTITKIDSGGVAEKAGLKVGDCVISINQVPVNGAKGFNSEMTKYYPGDKLHFSVRREADTLAVALVLAPRILREQPHPMNRFEGGKSLRRDGFQHVILHDARIRSYECGSPLFDSSGNLAGINIARFSHTTTVALNVSELISFINTIDI
ncbi:trypsin-like peptidase domain-containing protein [Niabella hibiscisoli]|uniref:trypsin-like peptidase domain-containing protein n=1 Tax=Niabella hibiscisoli TaxID=1825928 RepID=UPI001F0D3A28|nr:trypsin-like peptidase domain-containing protein [Niabella hibiscisoli]MCH5720104.1 trypsin-like peptidase domain-containing protein [Niabella hibiscisoli]